MNKEYSIFIKKHIDTHISIFLFILSPFILRIFHPNISFFSAPYYAFLFSFLFKFIANFFSKGIITYIFLVLLMMILLMSPLYFTITEGPSFGLSYFYSLIGLWLFALYLKISNNLKNNGKQNVQRKEKI